jgi:two-component system, NtrC family, sensor histidine kinase HydH
MFKSIVAPVVLVSLIWIAFSVFSTFSLNSLIESNSRSLAEDVSTIESAWAMRRDSWRLQIAILESAQVDASQSRAAVESLENDFRKSLVQARKTSLTDPEVAAAAVIESRFAEYSASIHQMLDNGVANSGGLSGPSRADIAARASALADACRSLIEINEQLISQATSRNQRLYTIVTWVRFAAIIVGPAAGLLLGLWMTRRFRKSVSQISARLSQAGGTLNERAEPPRRTSADLPDLDRQAQIIASRVSAVVEELEQSRKQMIQAERLAAVGELAAGMAHEIRNPLTSVKLLIQNAVQPNSARVLSEKQAVVVLQEIARMESLVEDLLNFARPPRLQLVRHDLRVTLRRVINLVSSRAHQHAVRIEEDFPESAVPLSADPEQLLQAFLNLTINGIEAAPQGSVTIALRSDGHTCSILFCDSGGGIAPEALGRLFEPFVTTKERGTGLGLAICRRIVHEHGGTIRGENAPDGGAVFTIMLPLQNDAPAETPAGADAPPSADTPVSGRISQSVLVSQ